MYISLSEIACIWINSADPDEMPPYVAISTGSSLSDKYLFTGIQYKNSFSTIFLFSLFQKAGDKNISILHLSCRMSDLQFSLVLLINTCTCPLEAYAIK